MAEVMKIEIIGRETIKPSSPTPSHLKIFKLSFVDQLYPAVYTSLVLFYPNYNDNKVLKPDEISNHLKKSLSEALTLFYPLAGRVKDNAVIECLDDGAQYVEAKFNGLLSTFLNQQHTDEPLLRRFLPAEIESPEAGIWPLLLVQATFFDCGGVAIGVCVSHKLTDAATLSIFLKTWAGTAVPDFEADSYYHPGDTFSFALPAAVELKRVEGVAKRCVFDKSKIAALKAKFASDSVKQPTRVEVVTALVWRCLIGASRSTSSEPSADPVKPRYCLLTQSVDIRKRVDPPFPENSVGNLVAFFAMLAENNIYENSSNQPIVEHQLQDLVIKLRQGMKEFNENKAKSFRGDKGLQAVVEHFMGGQELITRDDVHFFFVTSWCNFRFYEVDLGLGKPIHVTIPSNIYENGIILMDTEDGDGVEVLLTLNKENMAFFENQLDRFFQILL